MEKLTRCFMSVLLLSVVLSSGLAEEKFFVEGGTLELGPNFSGDIQTVTWKLNNDMVAEWLKKFDDLTYYSTFKGRTTLNKVTGTLNITKLSSADSGKYSVEINNMVRPEKYNVKVIKEVPQPVLEFKPLVCSAASESCNLVCDGKTEGAEPVTYSWKMGEGDWVNGENSRTIKPNETKSIKTFSCRMKNPIDEKHSDTKENIFYNEDHEGDSGGGSSAGPAVGGVFVVILLVAGGAVGYVKREDIKKVFTKSGGNNKNNDVEQPFLHNQDDKNLDPLSKDGRNGAAPKGDDDGAAPKGDNDGAAPKGDDDGAAPKGDDDEAAPKGDDDGAAPKGDDDGAAPKGDDDEAAPKGDDDGAAPKGDDDGAAPKGGDGEAPEAAPKTGTEAGTGEESRF